MKFTFVVHEYFFAFKRQDKPGVYSGVSCLLHNFVEISVQTIRQSASGVGFEPSRRLASDHSSNKYRNG